MQGAAPVETRCIEDVEHLVGARLRVDRLHRGRNTHGENASGVQGVAQLGVIDPRSPPSEITRRRFGEATRSMACCTLSSRGNT